MNRHCFHVFLGALLIVWGLCLPARAQDTFGVGPANGGAVTAGTPFTLAVTVLSPCCPASISTGYGGPASFSSNDPSAVLPTTTVANGWSTGVSTFTATLFLASPPASTAITVTDPADININGTGSFTVLPASPTQFTFTIPSSAVQGIAFPVSVLAEDAYGNTATNFSGPDSVNTSDPAAIFTGPVWSNGIGVFSVTLDTVGNQTITITNSSNSSSGTSNAIVVISPTPTATSTPTFTGTPTATFTHTATVPFTATFTFTSPPTSTPTSTPTLALPVYTDTPTNTPTATLTLPPISTPTPTKTSTPLPSAPTYTPVLASITATPTPNVPLYLDSNFFKPQQNPLGMDVRVYQNGQVKLQVFNMAGERVRNIANQTLQQGNYRFYWDGLNDNGALVGNGVYYMVIQTPAGTKVQKVILLK